MLDGVLDDRLQHHAGYDHVQRLRIEVFNDPQLVRSKTGNFDIKIVIDEVNFLAQHHKCIVLPKQRAQDVRQFDDEVTRLLGADSHEGGDRIERIEQEVRIDLTLKSIQAGLQQESL